MTEQQPYGEPLGRQLDNLLAMRQQIHASTLSDLTAEDMDRLVAIARGDEPVIYGRGRFMSLNIVTRLPNTDQAVATLRTVMLATEDEQELRALAATNLGLLATSAAEQALVEGLTSTTPLVKTKVLRSLGQCGGLEALEAIDALEEDESAYVNKQRRLAQTLIAYREGLERDPLPYTAVQQRQPTEDDRLLDLTLQPVSRERLDETRSRFQGSRYGLTLANRLGFELNIGRANWMLFLNDAVARELVESLKQRRHIVGLLARHSTLGKMFDTQYIVLNRPVAEDQIEIMIVRTDGEVVYSGQASLDLGILQFVVSDVERAGTAPTYVEGSYSADGISLQVAYPFKRRTGKRTAQPLER